MVDLGGVGEGALFNLHSCVSQYLMTNYICNYIYIYLYVYISYRFYFSRKTPTNTVENQEILIRSVMWLDFRGPYQK